MGGARAAEPKAPYILGSNRVRQVKCLIGKAKDQ